MDLIPLFMRSETYLGPKMFCPVYKTDTRVFKQDPNDPPKGPEITQYEYHYMGQDQHGAFIYLYARKSDEIR